MSDQAIERVLSIFDEINTVPRKSRKLDKIHRWLMNWGKAHNFETLSDEALNILIRVPATQGYKDADTVILQCHMDMVCEKRPEVDHDFEKDPIISWRDGDWLRAKGTSLGADNGIALALFFDLVTDPEAEHPNLEILITADEEIGLVGAQKLEPGFLTGSILLNLDSEDEAVFTIGCAGGMDTNLSLPIERTSLPADYDVRMIEVGGLEGGHSGIEINSGKASANVLLVRALRNILDAIPEVQLAELSGGTAHNAIAREARALIAVPPGRLDEIQKSVGSLEATLQSENAHIEKKLYLRLSNADAPKNGFFSLSSGSALVDALRLIPHGVRAMSLEIESIVDTSMNFAIVKTEDNAVKVLTNRRSAVMSRGEDFSQVMFSLARLYGGSYETGNFYPSWEPQLDSALLERAKEVWKKLYGKEPVVEVTHAGLECGAIGALYPGMDLISFGPTILQPHSPDERLLIPSLGRVRQFFRDFLKAL